MTDSKTPFHNPFGALSSLRDKLPAAPAPAPDHVAVKVEPAAEARASAPAKHPRAVIRMERAGRGGKAATVIEQLDLTPAERDAWLKALKAALGCGGSIEGDTLMLQGDQRKRLPALLAARGVKKVTIG